MSKVCEICGKGDMGVNRVNRRGAPKRTGGAGRKITGKSKRRQKPNLQKVRIIVEGTPTRIDVCTGCLKAGKVDKLVTEA